MIDHLSVVVSDYEKSKAFYLQALAPTGHSRLVELPAAHGGRTPSAGFCPADGTDFWISQGVTIKPPIHIAFRVSSRATVDASPTCRTVRAESRSMTASLHGCARPAGTVIHLAARQSLHRRNCR